MSELQTKAATETSQEWVVDPFMIPPKRNRGTGGTPIQKGTTPQFAELGIASMSANRPRSHRRSLAGHPNGRRFAAKSLTLHSMAPKMSKHSTG